MDTATRAWGWQLVDAAAGLSEAATTPIVSYESDGPKLLGMGTFLQIGQTKLLVTAAHVVQEALDNHWPLGILHPGRDDQPSTAIPLTGVSQRTDGEYDVAVFELGKDTLSRLADRRFLTLQYFDIGTVHQGGFCMFGFPRSLAEPFPDRTGCGLRSFSYSASLYIGSTRTFKDYDRHHHLLIERSELGVSDRDGSPAVMQEDLEGISGCPVFQTWRNDRPRAAQTADDIRIVGVLTGGQREAFVATRWGRVVDLLWSAFPDLRTLLVLNGFTPAAVTGPASLMR